MEIAEMLDEIKRKALADEKLRAKTIFTSCFLQDWKTDERRGKGG